MPLLAPNPINDTTGGIGYAPSYTGPQYTTRSTGFVPQQSTGTASSSDYATLMQQIQQQIQPVLAAIQAGAGGDLKYKYDALKAQYDDAAKARDNALKLERLRDETSRYGVDAQRQTAMAQLEENARQFDATHGLELQKLGVDTARVATDYLSTPDRYFQAGNYLDFVGRALGKTTPYSMGAAPYGVNGQPTPKTWNDFAALSAYTTPNGAASAAQPTGGGGGGGAPAPTDGSDPRAKVLQTMVKALPPSAEDGLNDTDAAVLRAAQALYSTRLTPQAYQSLKSDPDLLGMTKSAGARLGYNPDAWLAQQNRNLPGMGSVRGV